MAISFSTKLVVALAIIIVLIIIAAWVSTIGFESLIGKYAKVSENTTFIQEGGIDPELYWYFDYSGLLYPDKELNPPKTDITNYLQQKPVEFYCSDCSDCSGDNCNSCTKCGEITKSGFVNCIGCNSTYRECNLCIDSEAESNFCKKVKDCIRNNYASGESCLIDEFSISGIHVNNTRDAILAALGSCKDESIKIPLEEGVEKEVCIFQKNLWTEEAIPDMITKSATARSVANIIFNFGKPVATYRITGFWTPGGQASSGAEDFFFLCKGGCLGKSPDELRDNLCSTEDKEGCTLYYYTCTDCRHECQKFDITYIGTIEKIEGLNKDIGLRYTDELVVNLYTDKSGINYQICDFADYGAERTKLYYDYLSEGEIPFGIDKVYYDYEQDSPATYPNNTRIKLGNLGPKTEATCNFDLYVCGEKAIANYEYETGIQIFNYIKDFDMGPYKLVNSGDYNFTMYNYAEFVLDRDYTSEEIQNIIKSGWNYWKLLGYPITFDPIITKPIYGIVPWSWGWGSTNVLQFPGLDTAYANDCKLEGLPTVSIPTVTYNCGADGICSGKLKLNVILRVPDVDEIVFPSDFSSDKDDYIDKVNKHFIFPFFTFCSSE